MASGGKEPPDKVEEINFACHPKTKCTTVVCVICESAYHRSDFEKINTKKYLSKTLVLCPQHAKELNITCSEHVELNDTVRKIIAQIKFNQKEKLKKEIIEELGIEQPDHNETIYEDKTEIECLKIENTLLKQLTDQLNEKIVLYKELLDKEKNKSIMKGKTYADVITNSKPTQKRVPKIFVKKIDKSEKTSTKNFVLHYLNKEKNVQTKRINYKNEENVIIDCMNEESATLIENILECKATKSFQIQKEQLMKPKIKIVGIENYNNIQDKELEADIIKRNQKNYNTTNNNFKILHTYTNKEKSTQSAIVEVTAEVYKNIKENNDKIFVGHQRCHIYDQISVKPCFKCGRFGHSAIKCRNEQACSKCADKHETHLCNSISRRCGNCCFTNSKFKTNYDTQHSVMDSDKCPIYKARIKKYIEMTDYPVKPTIPTFHDMADRRQINRAEQSIPLSTVPVELSTSRSSLLSGDSPSRRTRLTSVNEDS